MKLKNDEDDNDYNGVDDDDHKHEDAKSSHRGFHDADESVATAVVVGDGSCNGDGNEWDGNVVPTRRGRNYREELLNESGE